MIGCSSQDPNPPNRLKIENQKKIVIHDFRLEGSDTILIEKSEKVYDFDENLRESVTFFDTPMGFSDIRYQKVYLYDSLSNNIEIIKCEFDDSFGSYFYDTTRYEYDKNNNMILEITGRAGIHIRKHFYMYDSTNRLVKDYIYRWGSGQFLTAYETLYTYNSTNKLIEKNKYSVFLNPKPELLETEKFKYDEKGNFISYNLNQSSSTLPGKFVYNLEKQILYKAKGRSIKEWYNLQTIDLYFSRYLPDTVYFDYNSGNKKIREIRLYTSDLTNKQFNSATQKDLYLTKFQTDKKYNKIEQEIYFYDDKLQLLKIEYYIGTEIDKLSLDRIKLFEYQ